MSEKSLPFLFFEPVFVVKKSDSFGSFNELIYLYQYNGTSE
jgi:hypothetical protein